MKSIELKITDEAGLHARPASLVCKEAAKYNSKLELVYNDKAINLKSILGVMSLGVPHEATITVRAEGDDAEDALKNIEKAFKDNKLV
ncbi:MAG: HPr family phosphocarrier protein [Candidatus Izemoplasmataceae bacterium]|jgi:phosphocarrier protein HPr